MEFDKRDFEYEIEEALDTYAKEYVRTAIKLIKNEAERDIARFYRDYTPTYYNRTDNLRNNSIIDYYKNKGNGGYYGYVQISSEKMDPYGNRSERLGLHDKSDSLNSEPKSKTDTHAIAADAWIAGVHGLRSIPHMQPSPYYRLENYYIHGKYQVRAHQEALNAVLKSRHNILTF